MVLAAGSPPVAPRRISSLKFNFFRGNNRSSSVVPHPQNTGRRNELTIGPPSSSVGPIIDEEEGEETTTTTTAAAASTHDRAASPTKPHENHVHLHHPPPNNNMFEVMGRGRRGTLSGSQIGTEADQRSITHTNPRGKSPARSGNSDHDKPSSMAGKGPGAKLRMALSLLRRRSNSNLRKAYVAPPVDEKHGEENWAPFNEPLLDPDFAESAAFAPQRTGSPSSLPGGKRSPSRGGGFKFGLVRSNTRTVLSKPRQQDQPRRATVASIVLEKQIQTPSDWNDADNRPSSNHSTTPAGLLVPTDAPSSDSIFSRASGAVTVPSPGGGGLFPRPASLQRHWSEGSPKQTDMAEAKPPERAPLGRHGTNPERIRPLSFGAISNGYGSMRITEAAGLEGRVSELEAQVASLRGIIADSGNCPWQQQASSLQYTGGFPSSSPPPQEGSETAVAPEESILGVEQVSPRGSVVTNHDRERTLHLLEGLGIDRGSKRNTISTIRAPAHSNRISAGSGGSPSSVKLSEYAGMVALVKREQKARKRLEQQVAALQEQMAAVLHRQLMTKSSRSAAVANHGPLRPEFSTLQRKLSSEEVPTPDITPPSSSAARQPPGAHVFQSFDGVAMSDSSEDGPSPDEEEEDEDEEEKGGNFYKTQSRDTSELWKTPLEDGELALGRADSVTTFGEESTTMQIFPSSAERTMSLSQLTQKKSSGTLPARF